MGLTIRDVVDTDAEAVAALLTELGHDTDAVTIPARLAALRADRGMALLARDERGEALGCITVAAHSVLHAPGPVAIITALVVAEAARGRGVGRALVARAKAWAAERGCVRLMVTSAERRADAHAFYPACGMPYTGRRFATSIPVR